MFATVRISQVEFDGPIDGSGFMECAERMGKRSVPFAMARIYLYVNAALYLVLAAWCTLKHQQTSVGSGYLTLSPSGRSEYLVVYGGLQIGLAIFYAYLASRPAYVPLGIVFSVMLYAPIVVYRLITVSMNWPVSSVTLGTGSLELILLIWSVLLWRR